MKVSRKYHCKGCGHVWQEITNKQDKWHDCPQCSVETKPPQRDWSSGKAPSVRGLGQTASKAVDFTYQMAERDYGLTDMSDTNKEGEIAAKMPAVSPEMTAAMKGGSMFNQQSTSMGLAAGAKAERMKMGLPDAMSLAMPSIKQDTLGPIGRARRNPMGRG